MPKRAEALIAEDDLEKVVDYAIDLNRRIELLDEELEKLKVYLRDQARKKGKGSFEVDLDGLTGTITVKFPGLQLKVKKGMDLKELEVNIPPEVFAELFRRTIVIVPALEADDFLEALGELAPAQKKAIEHFIEAVDQTPRVSVPR